MWGGVSEVHGEVGGVEGGIGSRFGCFVGEFGAGGGSRSVAASPKDVDGALTSLFCSMEGDSACKPVNQQIVFVQPIKS